MVLRGDPKLSPRESRTLTEKILKEFT